MTFLLLTINKRPLQRCPAPSPLVFLESIKEGKETERKGNKMKPCFGWYCAGFCSIVIPGLIIGCFHEFFFLSSTCFAL